MAIQELGKTEIEAVSGGTLTLDLHADIGSLLGGVLGPVFALVGGLVAPTFSLVGGLLGAVTGLLGDLLSR